MEKIHAAGRQSHLQWISAEWPHVPATAGHLFLGHALRSHFGDVIKAPIPDELQALAERLQQRAFFDAQSEITLE
jgi:hypothetical protein